MSSASSAAAAAAAAAAASSATEPEDNKQASLEVGAVYKATNWIGGRHHTLGLFVVHKLGKKFASMRKIKTVAVSERVSGGSGGEDFSSQQARSTLPLKDVHQGRSFLVAFKNYDPLRDTASADSKALGDISYKRVLPDADGRHSYTASHQSYY